MDGFIDFSLIFFSFLFGTLYAGKILRFCKNKQIIDTVNNRSSHKNPTPRGGGLSFVVIILLTMFISIFYLNLTTELKNFLIACTISGAAIAYLGWLDDKHQLNAKIRFLIQLICIAATTYFMPSIFHGDINPIAEKTLITLAWLWFLNLYNFMDGIDGIAAMEAIFIATAVSLLVPSPFKPILLIIAGSVLGFLRINWHPAKIFMGDVGSTFLGFILGGMLIVHCTMPAATGANTLFGMFIIPMLFTFDATFTLIKRTLQGKKPWQAHNEHWYQRAIKAGYSHSDVVKKCIVINVLLFIIALVSIAANFTLAGIIMALILLSLAARYIYYVEGK